MKTLDEVISYFDNQTQQRHVYLTEDAEDIYNDALHYLKTIETTENLYHDAVNELSKWKDEDWKDRYLPLTWDELRTMEGKSVWVEPWREWMLITLIDNGSIWLLSLDGIDYDLTLHDDWQAYRKERTE